MKRLLAIFAAIVAVLFGATKLNLIDVRPLAGGPATLYMLAVSAGGAWTPVILDPAGSVVVDTSVTPGVLKAPASNAIEINDDFTAGAGQTVFVTSAAPKSRVLVYRNGLLGRPAFSDYSETQDPVTKRVTITLLGVQPGDGIVLSCAR